MRFLVLCGLAWLGFESLGLACRYDGLPDFEIADEQDVDPPPAPHVELERIKRGKEPAQEGCSQEQSSCDDIGYVLLSLEANGAVVDPELGYMLEVKGKSPAEFERYQNRPVASREPGQLRLLWTDGEGNTNYDFEILIWSVDRAGNMSDAPGRVHVESSGSDGCAMLTSHAHGNWLSWLMLLLLARRARQRSA